MSDTPAPVAPFPFFGGKSRVAPLAATTASFPPTSRGRRKADDAVNSTRERIWFSHACLKPEWRGFENDTIPLR